MDIRVWGRRGRGRARRRARAWAQRGAGPHGAAGSMPPAPAPTLHCGSLHALTRASTSTYTVTVTEPRVSSRINCISRVRACALLACRAATERRPRPAPRPWFIYLAGRDLPAGRNGARRAGRGGEPLSRESISIRSGLLRLRLVLLLQGHVLIAIWNCFVPTGRLLPSPKQNGLYLVKYKIMLTCLYVQWVCSTAKENALS